MHDILLSRYRGNYRCLPTGFEDEFVALHYRRPVVFTFVTSEDASVGGVGVVRTVVQHVPRTLGQPVVVSINR